MSLIKYKQYLILLAMVVVCLGLNYWFDEQINPYVLRVIINCGIACILALSLNLISGCAGQFSLGHAGFMAVGAYFSSYLTTVLALPEFFHGGIGSQICILMGGVVAGIAGYLVGLPSLRLRGDYLAIVTLGFGEVIRIVFLNIESLGGARGLPSIPRTANFFWVAMWLIITFVFLFRLIRSSYGRAILSIRENEIAAESMGIDVSKYKSIAFVFSSWVND
jgi:branched-chain amino acid transport system permease protein